VRQRPVPAAPAPTTSSRSAAPTPPAAAPRRADRPRKLTYKEQQELAALPDRIDALEAEKGALYERLGDPAVLRDGAAVATATARLKAVEDEVAAAVARWEELETVASGA
jgi:ATP-binding cassette subfamily F protein uup